MTQEELYALALFERDPQRIAHGIEELLPSDAEWNIVACIRAYGHMARRFKYFDRGRIMAAVARGRQMGKRIVDEAIDDLREDLSIFVGEEI